MPFVGVDNLLDSPDVNILNPVDMRDHERHKKARRCKGGKTKFVPAVQNDQETPTPAQGPIPQLLSLSYPSGGGHPLHAGDNLRS